MGIISDIYRKKEIMKSMRSKYDLSKLVEIFMRKNKIILAILIATISSTMISCTTEKNLESTTTNEITEKVTTINNNYNDITNNSLSIEESIAIIKSTLKSNYTNANTSVFYNNTTDTINIVIEMHSGYTIDEWRNQIASSQEVKKAYDDMIINTSKYYTTLKNDFTSLMKDKKGFDIMVFSNNINIDDKCLIYIRHDDKVFSLYNS